MVLSTNLIVLKQMIKDRLQLVNSAAVEKVMQKIRMENRVTRIKAMHGLQATNSWKGKVEPTSSKVSHSVTRKNITNTYGRVKGH